MNFIFIFCAKYLHFFILLGAIFFISRQNRTAQKKILLFALFSLPLTFVLGLLAGHFYYHPRPFVTGNFIPLIPHKPSNGFPSHHALIAFAVSALVFVFSKKWGIVLGMLGVLVGAGRVYVGVHSPVDILGSFGISILAAAFLSLGPLRRKISSTF